MTDVLEHVKIYDINEVEILPDGTWKMAADASLLEDDDYDSDVPVEHRSENRDKSSFVPDDAVVISLDSDDEEDAQQPAPSVTSPPLVLPPIPNQRLSQAPTRRHFYLQLNRHLQLNQLIYRYLYFRFLPIQLQIQSLTLESLIHQLRLKISRVKNFFNKCLRGNPHYLAIVDLAIQRPMIPLLMKILPVKTSVRYLRNLLICLILNTTMIPLDNLRRNKSHSQTQILQTLTVIHNTIRLVTFPVCLSHQHCKYFEFAEPPN